MPMELNQITLRRQSAMLDFEDGQMPEAEASLGAIIDELRNSGADARYELCRSLLDRATVLSFANRWDDALNDLQECNDVAQQLKLMNRRQLLVNVYQQQAKLYATEFSSIYNATAAREVLANLESLNFKNWLTSQTVAELAYQEGDWKTAANGYREVAEELAAAGWVRGVAASKLRSGRAFLELGELDEAEKDLDEALRFFEQFGPADILASTKIHTARLLSARGEPEKAWQLAEAALELVESGIRKFRALFDQQRFVLDKLTNYQHAFDIALATDGEEKIWRAWAVAERAKSFYLCQVIASADIRLFEGVDPAQLAKLNELENQLDQIEARIGATSSNRAEPERRAALEKEFNQLSKAKEKLQESLMRANPRWGALKTPPQLDLSAEVTKLDSKWTPLSYFWQTRAAGALLHIFYAGKDRQPHHVTIEWSTAEMEKLAEARARLVGQVSPMIKIFPPELIEKIFPAEVSSSLETGQSLLVSPHELLQMWPLHALPIDQSRRLIDLCPIQYIPTLALLPFRREASRADKVLLMGCEQDGFLSPPLRKVPVELDSLNHIWSQARPGKTTKCAIESNGSPAQCGWPLESWGEFEVLHFACHGHFPEGQPLDAALRLGNDAVRTSEFFRSQLNAKVVCLSACSLGRVTQEHSGVKLVGNEWIGLYLPLFYAGARGLVVSLWEANDKETAIFMKEFHLALSEDAALGNAFQRAIQSVARKPEALWANWYVAGFPD